MKTTLDPLNVTRAARRTRTLWVLVLWLVTGTVARATHIVGAEIGYKCLGGNQYEITLTVYRDCNAGSAPFDNPAHVAIYNPNTGLVKELKIYNPVIEQLDAVFNDPCLFVPDYVCVERAVYTTTTTLFPAPGGYTLVYQRCCRNETITNIQNPLETGATYELELTEEAMAACNSTPVFNQIPPIFICIGKPIDYQHFATDPDGDSLVYRLCTPLTGGSLDDPQPIPPGPPPYDSIVWAPGFSLNDMLGNPDDPLTINPVTGRLTGFPGQQGTFVVGVCVEEYRNGQLLSTVRRDFQYNVGVCGEIFADFDAPHAICDTFSLQFHNTSNVNVQTDFLWYPQYPDTTIAYTDTDPVHTYPDTGWYQVMLIAAPGSQCADTVIKPLYVQDNSLFPDFAFDVYDCADSSALRLRDLSYDTMTSVVGWQWEVLFGDTTLWASGPQPDLIVPSDTSGIIRLTASSFNNCVESIAKPFQTGINDPLDAMPDSLRICRGDSIALNPDFNPDFTYFWTANAAPDTMAPNPVVAPDSTQWFGAFLWAPDSLCTSADSIFVEVTPLPVLDYTYDIACDGLTATFINQSQYAPDGVVWEFGPDATPATATGDTVVVQFADFGDKVVRLSTAATAFCPDSRTDTVHFPVTVLEADFEMFYSECSEHTIELAFANTTLNTLNNTASVWWDFGPYGTSTEAAPVLSFSQNASFEATLVVITDKGCTDTITRPVSVQLVDVVLPDTVLICPGASVALNPDPTDSIYDFYWTPADGLDDPASWNPVASPAQTTTYTAVISAFGADTCTVTKQITVVVAPAIELAAPSVQTCAAETTLSATTAVPVTFTWTNAAGSVLSQTDQLTVPVSGTDVYTVTAVDQYGCSETESVVVAGGPVDVSVPDVVKGCTDEVIQLVATNLDPNDTLTYNWYPPDKVSDPSVPDPVVTAPAGTYIFALAATNQFGCSDAYPIQVVVVDEHIALAFDYTIQCDGLTVTFDNQSQAAFDYVWDFGLAGTSTDTSTAVAPTFIYPDTGTYVVTLDIAHDVGCVTPAVDTVVLVEPEVKADFTYDYSNCSENAIEIAFYDQSYNAFNNTVSWAWSFSNGQTASVPDPVVTVTQEGPLVVSLTITTAQGCANTKVDTLFIDFTEVTLANQIVLCKGDTTELNPDGDPTYQYEWIPAYNLSDPHAANPLAWPEQTTTYTVRITNFSADTCVLERSVTVFVPEEVQVDGGPDRIACEGPVLLNAVSPQAIHYEWYAADGTVLSEAPFVSVLPDEEADYVVAAADPYGCVRYDTVHVINGIVEIETTPDLSTCMVDSLSLSANNLDAGDTLTWQWTVSGAGQILSDPTQADITVKAWPSLATFVVRAENQFGCMAFDTVVVHTYDTITVEAGPNEIACDGPVTLTAQSNLAASYAWYDAGGNLLAQTQSVAVLPEEQEWYYVTAMDVFGCTDTDSVLVTNGIIEVELTPDFAACLEDTFAIQAVNLDPGDDLNYSWVASGTGQILTDPEQPEILAQAAPGTAWFIVSLDNQFGCKAIDSVRVDVWPEIVLEVPDDTVACKGPVTLVANANLPVTFNWFMADSIVGTGAAVTVLPPEEAMYYVEATDVHGCKKRDSVHVRNGILDLDYPYELATCPVPEYLVETHNLDEGDTLSYSWQVWGAGQALGPTDSSALLVAPDTGQTWLALHVENQFGCSLTDTIGLLSYEFDAVVDTFVRICPGVPTPLNPHGNAAISYEWWPATGLDDPHTWNPVATLDSSMTYTVTITTVYGADTCQAMREVFVQVNPPIELAATPDTVLCEETTLTLFAEAQVPVSYAWYELPDVAVALGTADSLVVTPTGDHLFAVVATDDLECRDTAFVDVRSHPVDIEVPPLINFCREAGPLQLVAVNLTPDEQLMYQWFPDDGTIHPTDVPDPVIEPTGDVTYTVVAWNSYGCADTARAEVRYFDLALELDVTATPDTLLFGRDPESQLEATFNPTWSYFWYPSETLSRDDIYNPVATPDETTTYVVEVSNAAGCMASDTVQVVVKNPDCDEPFIFVPSAFTPNGDGYNDVLYVRGYAIESLTFTVFNRWGQKLFETTNPLEGWDGTFNGQPLPPDTYGYYVDIKCYNGGTFFKKGSVTLIR